MVSKSKGRSNGAINLNSFLIAGATLFFLYIMFSCEDNVGSSWSSLAFWRWRWPRRAPGNARRINRNVMQTYHESFNRPVVTGVRESEAAIGLPVGSSERASNTIARPVTRPVNNIRSGFQERRLQGQLSKPRPPSLRGPW